VEKCRCPHYLHCFWPRSLEAWVQLPKCHSAAIHFHDLVVSAGNPRTSVALSGSPLPRFASSPICGYQRFPWARYSAIHLRLRVVFS